MFSSTQTAADMPLTEPAFANWEVFAPTKLGTAESNDAVVYKEGVEAPRAFTSPIWMDDH